MKSESNAVSCSVFPALNFVLEHGRVSQNWDETHTVGQIFVRDDGGVLPHVDCFDGHGRHFSDQDATEGIGEGCIDAREIEDDFF